MLATSLPTPDFECDQSWAKVASLFDIVLNEMRHLSEICPSLITITKPRSYLNLTFVRESETTLLRCAPPAQRRGKLDQIKS